MEIWPYGAYEKQMPYRNIELNLAEYWKSVGFYLETAIKHNEHDSYRKKTDGDRQ